MKPKAVLSALICLFIASFCNLNAENYGLGRLAQLNFTIPEEGVKTPPVLVYRIEEGKSPLQLDLIKSGKVTLLYFWSSLVVPSLNDLPLLSALQKNIDLQENEIIIAAINLNEDAKLVEKILSEKAPDLATYLYPAKQTVESYTYKDVPVAFIMNKEGQIVARAAGNIPWNHPDILRSLLEVVEE